MSWRGSHRSNESLRRDISCRKVRFFDQNMALLLVVEPNRRTLPQGKSDD
jgi:hypothetical protein